MVRWSRLIELCAKIRIKDNELRNSYQMLHGSRKMMEVEKMRFLSASVQNYVIEQDREAAAQKERWQATTIFLAIVERNLQNLTACAV
jgi:hypothetical protein